MGKKPAKLEPAFLALAVDVARRRRSKSALGLAHAAALHPAFVGARQRGRGTALCPSRADAQDGEDVAAEHRRRGHAHALRPRGQHSHDRGAEIEALAGSNPSFAAWEQNEPYTIALLIKGRSGGASTKHLYRSGTSSTADHILWLSSGTTPNLRHQASSGTVTITSSVAIVNDTTWSTIVETWRPGRLELYVGRDIVQRAQDGRQWLEPGSAGIPLERSMPVQLTARGVGLAALVISTLKTPPPLIGPALAGEAWTPAILTDPALADVYLPDFSYAGYHWGEEPPPRPPATLDVTDFGAVADDREDDTAAILKAVALANAASEPVVLQFPAGRFILRDILYIKRSDFWVGHGQVVASRRVPEDRKIILQAVPARPSAGRFAEAQETRSTPSTSATCAHIVHFSDAHDPSD
jgi:hypothetical protein